MFQWDQALGLMLGRLCFQTSLFVKFRNGHLSAEYDHTSPFMTSRT